MQIRNTIVIVLIFLIFGGIGVFIIVSGVNDMKYGEIFKKEATEGFAVVELRDAEVQVHSDNDGGTYTTTDYYLYLRIDIDGLPQRYKKRVNYSLYEDAPEGTKLQIFYMPGDSDHVALNINEYEKSGKSGIVGGALWTLCTVGAFVWMFRRD